MVKVMPKKKEINATKFMHTCIHCCKDTLGNGFNAILTSFEVSFFSPTVGS